MDPEHKKKIQLNLLFIKDNISEVDVIVDHLIQMETFSLEQRSRIVVPNSSPRDHSQRLIDCLIAAGPAAYSNFVTTLQLTGNGHVADKLNDTVVETPILSRINTYVIDSSRSPRESTSISLEEDQVSMRDLKESIFRLESNMSQMQKDRKELDDRLSNTITELQQEVKIYRQNAEEYLLTRQKLEAKEEEYTTLQKAYIKLKEQLEESKQRLTSKNKENVQQAKLIEELEEELQRIKADMDSVEEERASMKQIYANLTDNISKKESEIQIMRQEAEKKLKEKEDMCKRSQRDRENLKQQNTVLQEQLQQQKKTIETLQLAVEEISKMKIRRETTSPPFCSTGNGDKTSKNRFYSNTRSYKPPSTVNINIKKKQ